MAQWVKNSLAMQDTQEMWVWSLGWAENNMKGVPGGSAVKSLSAKQKTQIRSLGWEDPLEEEMATHSSILAWKIPPTEEPGGLRSKGSQRVRQDLATKQQNKMNCLEQSLVYANY